MLGEPELAVASSFKYVNRLSLHLDKMNTIHFAYAQDRSRWRDRVSRPANSVVVLKAGVSLNRPVYIGVCLKVCQPHSKIP